MGKITVKNTSGETLSSFDADVGKTLLKQIEAAGVEIPNACKAGICASCLCTIDSGKEYLIKDYRGEPSFPLGEDEIMTCIGGIRETDSEIVLTTLV